MLTTDSKYTTFRIRSRRWYGEARTQLCWQLLVSCLRCLRARHKDDARVLGDTKDVSPYTVCFVLVGSHVTTSGLPT
jgi:hypothetical protein